MRTFTLAEIAKKIHADLKGDPQCQISRVESLSHAKSGAISFLANNQYQSFLATTQASAVILRAEHAPQCPTNALVVNNPELAITHLLNDLYPTKLPESGIHPTAIVGQHCQIDASATIGPYCVIEERVRIGAHTQVGAHTFIADDVEIGEHCQLLSRVTLYHQVRLGHRVVIHSGAVLGADGFGLVHDGKQWVKIPQIGRVVVGNDVDIGANTTIDRGALQDTVIGNGVKIDNLVQIAHNVKIGDNTAIAACTGIAGSTEIGQQCMIGGASCINGHIRIGDQVILGGMSAVAQSVLEPGVYSSSLAVQKIRVWQRNMLRFLQLDDIAKRLRKLEKGIYHERDGH